MSTVFTIIIALIAFGVIITVHEFGHFAVAKACGIKVNEFAIGMGPTLFKFTKGETKYSLRLLPIGGFCSMEGEDTDSEDERAFGKKPVWQRFLVVAAGALMNILLAFIIIIISISIGKSVDSTIIAKFDENATSNINGLMLDDKIVEVNGRHIFVSSDIVYEMLNDEDGVLEFKVIRDGKKVTLDTVQFEIKTDENGNQSIVRDFWVYGKDKTVFGVLGNAVRETISTGRMIYLSLFDMITGKYGINDLSGPIGVVSVIGQATSQGIETFLYLVSLLSINIGIFNLLPLPALDGGRLVFLIVEGIRRKPIPTKYEGMVHFIGLALLMLLMLIVSANDIIKIFRG